MDMMIITNTVVIVMPNGNVDIPPIISLLIYIYGYCFDS